MSEKITIEGVYPFDPLDPEIRDQYADDSFIVLNNSDVAITFATGVLVHDGKTYLKPHTRIHMTHDTFLLFVGLVVPRAQALLELYGNDLPTLRTKDQEKVSKVIAAMLNPVKPKESE